MQSTPVEQICRRETSWWLALLLVAAVLRAGILWNYGFLLEEDRDNYRRIAERVEGNLLAAKQEVEKLALLLPAGEVSLAAIRDAVTDVSRFERDTLLAAIHAGDASRVLRVVASL